MNGNCLATTSISRRLSVITTPVQQVLPFFLFFLFCGSWRLREAQQDMYLPSGVLFTTKMIYFCCITKRNDDLPKYTSSSISISVFFLCLQTRLKGEGHDNNERLMIWITQRRLQMFGQAVSLTTWAIFKFLLVKDFKLFSIIAPISKNGIRIPG
jgi:hypothetical protein